MGSKPAAAVRRARPAFTSSNPSYDSTGRIVADQDRLNEVRQALRRLDERDLLELIPDISEVLRRTATEWWWMKREVFDRFEAHGFHVTQDHFYSPAPSVSRLAAALWDGPRYAIPAFTVDLAHMRDRFDELAVFASELGGIPADAEYDYCWNNVFFPNFDAIVYYGLCRRFRPAMVFEIGAGYSTLIALEAAARNGQTRVRCVEPYPSRVLGRHANRLESLIARPVQDVPLTTYADLRSGDVLFVDTSHVSKIGSDLHHILFHVLPALPQGVFVHFHDIFLPREYPREWVIERNWFWNEQYLLLAFLMCNRDFSVLLLNNDFLHTHRDHARRALGGLNAGALSGSSMWLRKEH